MARILWLCLLTTLLPAVAARAQMVEFANGDRLSGKWERVQGETLDFNSDMLGNVAIPITKIRSITIEKPLVVVLTSGDTVPGSGARLTGGVWVVESKGEERTVEPKRVAAILAPEAYNETLAAESSKPWRNWTGRTNFGYSLQQGDQNARTVSLGLNAVRSQMDSTGFHEKWRTTYSFNMLFAHASSDGQRITSNSLTTQVRQDYFFRPHNFLFILGQVDHIQPQNLYLRQTYGGGFGHDLLTGDRLKLSILGGATFANEKFVGTVAEQFGEALTGERISIQLNHKIQLEHSLNFYPNLSSVGDYRLDTTSTLSLQLNSWLSANFGLTDFYVSRIPTGSFSSVSVIGPGGTLTTTTTPAHNNNLTVTAGFGVRF